MEGESKTGISDRLDEYSSGAVISPKSLNLKVGDKGDITFLARKGIVEFIPYFPYS